MKINRVFSYTSLEEEGLISDLIRTIQLARKSIKLQVSDKIGIVIHTKGQLVSLIKQYQDHISHNCLLHNVSYCVIPSDEISFELFSLDI